MLVRVCTALAPLPLRGGVCSRVCVGREGGLRERERERERERKREREREREIGKLYIEKKPRILAYNNYSQSISHGGNQ